jgi:hypothetical protein
LVCALPAHHSENAGDRSELDRVAINGRGELPDDEATLDLKYGLDWADERGGICRIERPLDRAEATVEHALNVESLVNQTRGIKRCGCSVADESVHRDRRWERRCSRDRQLDIELVRERIQVGFRVHVGVCETPPVRIVDYRQRRSVWRRGSVSEFVHPGDREFVHAFLGSGKSDHAIAPDCFRHQLKVRCAGLACPDLRGLDADPCVVKAEVDRHRVGADTCRVSSRDCEIWRRGRRRRRRWIRPQRDDYRARSVYALAGSVSVTEPSASATTSNECDWPALVLPTICPLGDLNVLV